MHWPGLGQRAKWKWRLEIKKRVFNFRTQAALGCLPVLTTFTLCAVIDCLSIDWNWCSWQDWSGRVCVCAVYAGSSSYLISTAPVHILCVLNQLIPIRRFVVWCRPNSTESVESSPDSLVASFIRRPTDAAAAEPSPEVALYRPWPWRRCTLVD